MDSSNCFKLDITIFRYPQVDIFVISIYQKGREAVNNDIISKKYINASHFYPSFLPFLYYISHLILFICNLSKQSPLTHNLDHILNMILSFITAHGISSLYRLEPFLNKLLWARKALTLEILCSQIILYVLQLYLFCIRKRKGIVNI